MKIPRLEFPSGAGNFAEFGDPDMLTARDYREMKSTITTMDAVIAAQIDMVMLLARKTITSWQVDYLGNPMPPGANPDLLDRLKIGDTRALEAHLMPYLNHYMFGGDAPDTQDGDPQTPASESG